MTADATQAEGLFHEGNRLLGEGDLVGAEQAFRKALVLAPLLAEVHANLALLLERAGRYDEAEAGYRRALELAPWQTQAYINFGAMLEFLQRFAEAESAYRSALAISPESPMAWANLGVLMACVKRESEAEACYRRALTLSPGYRSACFNLAYLLLRQGRFDEGWLCLESRDWYERLEKHIGAPRWQGESLTGKSFLIGLEAGHGDMIQFCRYAEGLKARGASRVSVLCHPGLKALFATFRGVDEAIAINEFVPGGHWDYWSPPLSLPRFFQTRLETIPADLPYVAADPAKVAAFAALIGNSGDDLRVGLVWKGNPRFENDAERSLRSLDQLAPLAQVAGIRYFSLQKGEGEHEAACSAALPLVDLGSRIGDFSETAAIVMNLDVVICVDTAVAHLAGALGKPCWVMLPDYKTDWRWLSDRDDSPWYPGVMRLFRQGQKGAWEPVVAEIKLALEVLRKTRGLTER